MSTGKTGSTVESRQVEELEEARAELVREHERLLSALRAEEEAKRATKTIAQRFALLKSISEVALANGESAVAVEEILDHLREGLPADCAALLLRDEDSDLLRVRACKGAGGSAVDMSVRIGQWLAGRVAAEGRSATMDDACAVAPLIGDQAGSAAAVPLLSAGRVLGVLQVGMANRRHVGAEDVHLLEEVAARLVAVLDRQRLLEAERQARAQAEAALRQRDEVLAIVAHDLRNPLNRISMSASWLRESIGAQTGPQPWDVMQRGVRDMDRLIQDLLDVSRMEGGALRVERSELPLAPLLAELQEQHAELARAKGVSLSCRADTEIPYVLADRKRLVQALSNLVDNALRLTPSGGTVAVEALGVPGYVEFVVRDSGPGIPADQLPHLFDRFWQGARARRGGAGLGLAIVKGIVEAHGDRVFAESRPGEGATFRFWIAAPA
jgi:signal transduction histidine kinase